MGLKKISSIYAIVVGISMFAFWGMFYLTGQIVELSTKPIEISFHLVDEFLTAILLIIGGIGLLRGRSWAPKVHFFSLGMLLYSVVASNGYYSQRNGLTMIIMFSVLAACTVFILVGSLISKDTATGNGRGEAGLRK